MTNTYSKKNFLLLSAFLFMAGAIKTNAQCSGVSSSGAVAYDTTVTTSSGNYATQFSFPKFDPQNGMVTCVKLCLTITGRVTMFLENNVNSPAIYNVNYKRKDTLTGPGLNSPLTNQVTTTYGPYNLDASDGVPFSGPDFVNIGPDTVLQSVTICKTLIDSVDLVQFYGHDSVTYTYNINAGATVTGSGDYLFSVGTQGSVNYSLQYCYCTSTALNINLSNFSVTKKSPNRAELNWSSLDDGNTAYHYEAEVSRDGFHFTTMGSFPVNFVDHTYKTSFVAETNDPGNYFFRIKQAYNNGYTRFSEIKYVQLENSEIPKFTIYPNPSEGIVGIKFDNNSTGQLLVQIFNAQGQNIAKKEIVATEGSYFQLATLQRGVYWLKLTDVMSQLSCVNQLLIK